MKSGKRIKAIIIICICVAAAIAIGALIYINGVLNKVNYVSKGNVEERIPRELETFEKEVTTSSEEEIPDTIQKEDAEELFDVDRIGMMDDDDIKNILLIGQDAREGEERQRSDTMIICSINTKEDKVTLVSLMRDMYVPIPGYSANRINAAYAFGGMDLLDETIEQDFGIPIDGNIEVDFEGFVEAMDVLGGVEVELTNEEAGYLSQGGWEDQEEYQNDGTWDLHEGVNTLTPAQALAYSRIRYVGNSDWERTERQRRVIISAFEGIRSSSTAKLLSVADKILPYITTDLTSRELLKYVKTLSVNDISNVDSFRLPADGTYSSERINGMAVLVPDLVKNSELLKEYIYGDAEVPEIEEDEDDPDVRTKSDTDTTTVTTNSGNAGGGYNTNSQQQTYTAPAVQTAPANTDQNPAPQEPANTEPVNTDPGTADSGTADPAAQDPAASDPGSVPDAGSTEPAAEPPAADAGTDVSGGDQGAVDTGGGEAPPAAEPVYVDPGAGGGAEPVVVEAPTGGGAEGG